MNMLSMGFALVSKLFKCEHSLALFDDIPGAMA